MIHEAVQGELRVCKVLRRWQVLAGVFQFILNVLLLPQDIPLDTDTPTCVLLSLASLPQSSYPAFSPHIMSDADTDPGYRSRSQSRRRRRQNQRAKGSAQSGDVKAQSMASVQEQEPEQQQQLNNPATNDTTEMQPFERIKPPSQSMEGPVKYARAMRGEIPMSNGQMAPPQALQQNKPKDMMEQDGLKLRLELNLDIEIELKASIHGDLTLAIVN